MSSTEYNNINDKTCLWRLCQLFNGLLTLGMENVLWLIFPINVQGKEMRKEGTGPLN